MTERLPGHVGEDDDSVAGVQLQHLGNDRFGRSICQREDATRDHWRPLGRVLLDDGDAPGAARPHGPPAGLGLEQLELDRRAEDALDDLDHDRRADPMARNRSD